MDDERRFNTTGEINTPIYIKQVKTAAARADAVGFTAFERSLRAWGINIPCEIPQKTALIIKANFFLKCESRRA
jgi:hypothetical protein